MEYKFDKYLDKIISLKNLIIEHEKECLEKKKEKDIIFNHINNINENLDLLSESSFENIRIYERNNPIEKYTEERKLKDREIRKEVLFFKYELKQLIEELEEIYKGEI